jgi:hypothetical protein
MVNEELYINALVAAAKHDMGRGIRRDDILSSLSRILSRELFSRVNDRL